MLNNKESNQVGRKKVRKRKRGRKRKGSNGNEWKGILEKGVTLWDVVPPRNWVWTHAFSG
jgi:hypothetical protein